MTLMFNEFDFSMVFTTKGTIRVWPDGFKDIIFKNTEAFDILNFMIKPALLNNVSGKNSLLKKLFCFEKGFLFRISSGARVMP